MNAAIRARRGAQTLATQAAVEHLSKCGIRWTEFAERHNFRLQAVKDVVRGRPSTRGDMHEVARAIRFEAGATDLPESAEAPGLRPALAECAEILSEVLDQNLDNLQGLAAGGDAVICLCIDVGEELELAQRINAALCKARKALGIEEAA